MVSSDEKLRNEALENSLPTRRSPKKDVEGLSDIENAAEATLVRKVDFTIVPPVMLLYLFSFSDRVHYRPCVLTFRL